MKIVFYAGYQKTYLNPNKIESTGVGGTEQCIIHLASEIAKEHDVYVTGGVENLDYCNVKYRDQDTLKSELKNEYVDCVIACSYINYLLELNFLNFNNSIFWVHNTDFYPWYRGEEIANGGIDLLSDSRMTHIVCLTEWHKKIFIEQFPSAKNKVVVIGNGISKNLFCNQPKKRPNSFIYTSHSERGLELILDDWINIKKKIPDAVLNIATPEYGLEYFNEHFKQKILSLPSVIFKGSLSIKDLYKLMSMSKYWYYPTSYEETFCITALEMLGHKVTPITTEMAGLKETLNGFNISSLDKINSEKLDWNEANKYIEKCDWSVKKTQWMKYIYNMDSKQKNTNTIAKLNNDPVITKPNVSDVDEEQIIFEDESNNNSSNEDLNEDILQIDCVYVILEEASVKNLEQFKSEIRSKIKWFNGPIVGKKLLNDAKINDEWFSKNGYEFFNWKSKNSTNDWYNRDLTHDDMSLAISHHQIWVHAKNSNYRNIIVLEDGFKIEDDKIEETLVKVPSDYDLFYLGRDKLYADKSEIIITDEINKPSISYGTYGYMLSAKGVESLIQQNFNKYIMPISDFLISCYTKHIRTDLNFIVDDLIAYAPTKKIVSNSKELNGPQVGITSGRKYPELYDYWNNPDEWKKKFVAYATRTKEWELIIDEPFDNCFSMPLFTQEFCEKIREEAEHADAWTTDRHEFYPTTDMLLEVLDFTEIYYEVLKEFVMPAVIHLYNLTSSGWDCMDTEDFLAKYVPDAQGHLSLHHDASDITALVTLSNFDEYEGGGTYFSHQKKLVKEQQGYVSIHPGNITHRHGARATTKGKRYIIVSFMRQNLKAN